jgi:hypothetical protein
MYSQMYYILQPCRGSTIYKVTQLILYILKSENSQDYAQKPQQNCTFMSSASGCSVCKICPFPQMLPYALFFLQAVQPVPAVVFLRVPAARRWRRTCLHPLRPPQRPPAWSSGGRRRLS